MAPEFIGLDFLHICSTSLYVQILYNSGVILDLLKIMVRFGIEWLVGILSVRFDSDSDSDLCSEILISSKYKFRFMFRSMFRYSNIQIFR